MMANPLRAGIRGNKLPHFFCPGCGCGQVLSFYLRALQELGMKVESVVAIGGVGCTARIPVYLNTDALHGIHGRTLPWATGIKLKQSEVPVVIFAGDGDAASIGGNHLLHAARRNLDVTMIVVNNLNFAMTGGQVAPTTPLAARTATTPYGSFEQPLDICAVAVAAGASHVARHTTNQGPQVVKAIKTALSHRGFSLVEIVSQCPTHFGRSTLGSDRPAELLDWIKERTVQSSAASELPPEERANRIVTGEFVRCERPIFSGSSVYGREGEQ